MFSCILKEKNAPGPKKANGFAKNDREFGRLTHFWKWYFFTSEVAHEKRN